MILTKSSSDLVKCIELKSVESACEDSPHKKDDNLNGSKKSKNCRNGVLLDIVVRYRIGGTIEQNFQLIADL